MRYFFVGIKGSGMSALALILKGFGHGVIGSDADKYYFTQYRLDKEKIKIYSFGEYDFADEIDEVILGNSFDFTHVDILSAQKKKLKITKYKEKLNEIVKNKKSIAISGTNGKTTTTGMMVASQKNINPSFLIGDGTGYGNTQSDTFIFEACEYKETFLSYDPKYLVINNIEYDHPDFFVNEEHVIQVFQKFADKTQYLIINEDEKNTERIIHDNKLTFSLTNENCTLYTRNLKYTRNGIVFDLYYNKNIIKENLKLPFYGEYMVYNSLAVILVNILLENNIDKVIENLREFAGTSRRFQLETISKEKGIMLLDDYAHHPTAISLTFEAIEQKYPDFQKIAIFQSHTISRTEVFLEEFVESLSNFNYVIIDDIFLAAREKKETTNNILEKAMLKNYPDKIIKLDSVPWQKLNNVVICLLGAGDVDRKYKGYIKSQYNF